MKKMFLSALLLAFGATGLGLYAISPAEARVSTVQSGSPVLAAGATYAWSVNNGVAVGRADPVIANGIAEARLRAAIETAMAKRGYRKTHDRAAADLIVSYFVALQPKEETRVRTTGATVCGWRGCLRTWPGSVDVKRVSYTQGALVLDLTDRRSDTLIWRASSEKRISSSDLSQESLTATVMTMTRSLPAS